MVVGWVVVRNSLKAVFMSLGVKEISIVSMSSKEYTPKNPFRKYS